MIAKRQGGAFPLDPSGDVGSGRVAELFGLLSDHARAGILYALLNAEELSTDDLTACTGVPADHASDALRALRTARIVNSRKAPGGVFYRLRGDNVRRLLEVAGSAGEVRRPWHLRALDATSRSA